MHLRLLKSVTPLLLALLAAAALNAQQPVKLDPARKLAFVEQLVERYYVDTVDTTRVVEDAIRAMLATLDPHSSYSDAAETKELTEPLDGGFSGIGIRFQMDRDTLYIIESVAGGPCEKAGIMPGDRILECNGTAISGVKMPNADILKTLRGPKGSKASLKVLRSGSTAPVEFNVKRDDIPIYSIDAAYMVNDSVGYVALARFAASTSKEMEKALRDLRRQGMKHLVIDLCDNGGGYLKAATDLAEMFLRRGDLIVYTDSPKNGGSRFEAPADGPSTGGRVVVMANQYSASASEILAGALQDNDRGVVVGRRTFGKGLVQRPFPFPDGSMIRLTVARYHTPSGRCIQKPYNGGDDKDYRDDMLNRYRSGQLTQLDSALHATAAADSLLYHTLRRGRPVYGGGGIMPDIFVPLDTTRLTSWYRDILAKGVLADYTLRYVDAHRKQLKKDYPTEASYIDGFKVTPAMTEALLALAADKGVEMRPDQYEESRTMVEDVVKALVGRDLFEQSTYRRIMNPYNDIYTRALEAVTQPALYDAILDGRQAPASPAN